jgi:hypothetical protein
MTLHSCAPCAASATGSTRATGEAGRLCTPQPGTAGGVRLDGCLAMAPTRPQETSGGPRRCITRRQHVAPTPLARSWPHGRARAFSTRLAQPRCTGPRTPGSWRPSPHCSRPGRTWGPETALGGPSSTGLRTMARSRRPSGCWTMEPTPGRGTPPGRPPCTMRRPQRVRVWWCASSPRGLTLAAGTMMGCPHRMWLGPAPTARCTLFWLIPVFGCRAFPAGGRGCGGPLLEAGTTSPYWLTSPWGWPSWSARGWPCGA